VVKTGIALAVTGAAALVGAACGDGLTDTEREAAGAYELVEVNGFVLPFELGRPCGEVATNGYLELGQENRFYVEVVMYHPDCPEEAARDPQRWVGTGLWTVIDDDIRLVSDPGVQYVTFGAAPAPFVARSQLTAEGRFEVVGYEDDPARPSPLDVTFGFVR
jgi:hypothetical protein